MEIPLEDALAILDKWKEESAAIAVIAEGPFRQHRRPVDRPESLRAIHESGVRWSLQQAVKLSRVTRQGIVDFEGPAGQLSLSIGRCRFIYQEPREATPEIRSEAESETVSSLSVFFKDDEGFIFYEMREP